MLPIVLEWHWDLAHIIFMGFLYMVLTLVGLGLLTAFFLTIKNMQDLAKGGGHGHGHGDDHDLEESAPAH